jgi:YidC/Oxa1 family membrane protein insertase
MVFMGLIFHKVAAGLCLYIITSTLWGICEKLMLPKPAVAGSNAAAAVPVAAAATSNGSASEAKARRRKNKRR